MPIICFNWRVQCFETALLVAVKNGKWDSVNALLDANADIQSGDKVNIRTSSKNHSLHNTLFYYMILQYERCVLLIKLREKRSYCEQCVPRSTQIENQSHPHAGRKDTTPYRSTKRFHSNNPIIAWQKCMDWSQGQGSLGIVYRELLLILMKLALKLLKTKLKGAT